MGTRRGPFWWVFGVFATLLVVRNRYLFTTPIYEEGDAAANSILVDNAKGFTQLVGNYSRVGFHHPGPAFLYVQAFGEWFWYDVLGVVPTEWNGQGLAVMLLNAALIALTVHIVCQRVRPASGSRWLDVAVAGAALIFVASWWDLVTSTWPPFEYFAPYLLLLAAAASVASGAARDLWALGLATGLLVHGHAEFLFLAVSLAGLSVVALLWPHRRRLGSFLRAQWRALAVTGGVVAVLALPVAVHTVRDWPGEFGKYLTYGGGNERNGLGPALWYVARQWDASEVLAVPVLVASLAALVVAARRGREPFLWWALAVTGVGLTTVTVYAVVGIDSLSEPYILFFTRAYPMFALLVAVAAAVRFAPAPRALGGAVVAGALVLGLFSPALVSRQVTVGGLGDTLDQVPRGRPVVLHLASFSTWAEALPLAVEGQRHGVRLCLVRADVEMMATPAYMCTPDEVEHGLPLVVARKGDEPPGLVPLGELGRSQLLIDPALAPTPA